MNISEYFINSSHKSLKSLKSSNILFSQNLLTSYVKCGGVLTNNCAKRTEKETNEQTKVRKEKENKLKKWKKKNKKKKKKKKKRIGKKRRKKKQGNKVL